MPIGPPQSDTVAGITAVKPTSAIHRVDDDVLPTAPSSILHRTQNNVDEYTSSCGCANIVEFHPYYDETESEYAADEEDQESSDEASDIQEEPGNVVDDKQQSLDDQVIGINVATSNEPMNGSSAASANFLSPVLKENHLERFHTFLQMR